MFSVTKQVLDTVEKPAAKGLLKMLSQLLAIASYLVQDSCICRAGSRFER